MLRSVKLRRNVFPAQDFDSGDRSRRAKIVVVAMALLLCGLVPVSLATGAADVDLQSFLSMIQSISGGTLPETPDQIVLFDIRLPRIAMAILVGAVLGVAGTILQGLFRNPLADPGIIGVSAGASVGAVAAIILANSILAPISDALGNYFLPTSAFLGGLATTFVLYRIATANGQTSVATLLLAGIALAALAGAITGMLIFMADDRQLRDISFWGLGSLSGATWSKISSALPFLALGFLGIWSTADGLNAMLLGEAEARHLGFDVQKIKRIAILSVSASVGAAVAVSGGIGFIGVVVPHILRLAIGPNNRFLLPGSAFLGAVILLLADMVSRTLAAPAELPIGIITACLGAPFFLWLLLRQKGLAELS